MMSGATEASSTALDAMTRESVSREALHRAPSAHDAAGCEAIVATGDGGGPGSGVAEQGGRGTW
jgi:dihydrodipicolinate synthase/N-acetylneuraminate lyase